MFCGVRRQNKTKIRAGEQFCKADSNAQGFWGELGKKPGGSRPEKETGTKRELCAVGK